MYTPTTSDLNFFLAGLAIGGFAVGKAVQWTANREIKSLRDRIHQLRGERNTAEIKCIDLERYKSDINGLIATLARRAGLLKDKVAKADTTKGEVKATNYDKDTGNWTHIRTIRQPHPQDPLAAQANNAAVYGPNGKAPFSNAQS